MSTPPPQTAAYPWLWNALPLVAGLLDPVIGFLGLLGGLVRPLRVPHRADTPARRRRGITFVLGGIEGPSRHNVCMCLGMLASGERGSVVRFHWNRGMPMVRALNNQINRRHHERQSDALVDAIVDYRKAHPHAPVSLLAQSGGCWITVRALEKLPAGVRIRTAVLLCPALSPSYDLHRAGAQCDHALVSVGGPGDFILLGLGTTIFGTSDRRHTPAAGWIGWHHHPPKFVELRWCPAWLRHGYLGNHVSTSAIGFVRAVIAPWLKAQTAVGG